MKIKGGCGNKEARPVNFNGHTWAACTSCYVAIGNRKLEKQIV